MILAVVGPTGIGKTEVALHLARRIPCEIVVVDSMQVYRGMDIGTGKPSPFIRQEVPHHGIDLVDPEEEFDVARYVKAVAPVLKEIHAKGRSALLVGGSGLYLRGLLDGLCPAPGKDPVVREQLLEEGRRLGPEVLHTRLHAVDPTSAHRIHPNDLRKIVRALEVFWVSGRPLSAWHRDTTPSLDLEERPILVGLTCFREYLASRIQARIEEWFASGWLEEARVLVKRPLSRTARGALGYRELFAFLEGQADWKTTLGLIQRNTRRYAKRQWTWFKANPRIHWIWVEGKTPQALADTILNQIDSYLPAPVH